MKKSSSTEEIEVTDAYECGCCDPLLEGDSYPEFCGGQICAAAPVECQYSSRRQLRQEPERNLGMMKKKKSSSTSSTYMTGVKICVGGIETKCVDPLDPVYLADPTMYECGGCGI